MSPVHKDCSEVIISTVGKHGKVPDRSTISNWVRTFIYTPSTQKTIEWSVKTALTPENMEMLRTAVTRRSARPADLWHCRFPIGVSAEDFLQDFHFHLYKIQVPQKLFDLDYTKRVDFCNEILEFKNQEKTFMNTWLYQMKHIFIFPGMSISKICAIGVTTILKNFISLHSHWVTVRCWISSVCVYGPHFFEGPWKVSHCELRRILNNFFLPLLNYLRIDTDSVCFQQSGATAHTTQVTMDVLRSVLEDWLISRFGAIPCPARSSELSASDSFL